jgi:hypothetical protein
MGGFKEKQLRPGVVNENRPRGGQFYRVYSLIYGFKEHNNLKPHKNGRKEKEKALRHGSG